MCVYVLESVKELTKKDNKSREPFAGNVYSRLKSHFTNKTYLL